MPFGLLLDLWECHKQYHGISKPKVEVFIDDIIPEGIYLGGESKWQLVLA